MVLHGGFAAVQDDIVWVFEQRRGLMAALY